MSAIPPPELFDPDSNDPNRQPVAVWVCCAKCAHMRGPRDATAFGRLVYGQWFTDPESGEVRPGKPHGDRSDFPLDEAGSAAYVAAMANAIHTTPVWRWEALTEQRRQPRSHRRRSNRGRRFLLASGLTGKQMACRWCGSRPRANLASLTSAAVEAATRRQALFI